MCLQGRRHMGQTRGFTGSPIFWTSAVGLRSRTGVTSDSTCCNGPVRARLPVAFSGTQPRRYQGSRSELRCRPRDHDEPSQGTCRRRPAAFGTGSRKGRTQRAGQVGTEPARHQRPASTHTRPETPTPRGVSHPWS